MIPLAWQRAAVVLLLAGCVSAGCADANGDADDDAGAASAVREAGQRGDAADVTSRDSAADGRLAGQDAQGEAALDTALPPLAAHRCESRSVEGRSGGGGGGFCEQDSDCAGLGLWKHCHVPSRRCVRCKLDAHCEDDPVGNRFCSYDEIRGYASCVSCREDQHCAHGANDTGKCTPDGSCRRCDTDDDCAGTGLGKRCGWKGKRCVACLGDDDCVQGAQSTGKCFYEGGASYTCTGCDDDSYTCTRCDDDDDCRGTGLGQRCHQQTRRCVPCLESSDCATGAENTGRCYLTDHGASCDGCETHQQCQRAFPANEQVEWFCEGVADRRTCTELDDDYERNISLADSRDCRTGSPSPAERCREVGDRLSCACPALVDPQEELWLVEATAAQTKWNEIGCDALAPPCERTCEQ